MPILSIKHATTYRYRQPVAFGEHRIMLRPRDDEDQKLLQSVLEIAPKPLELAWGRDRLGNHVAIAHFDDRSDELRVVSTICLEHTPNGFYEADIKDYARIYPFSYLAEDWSRLRRFIMPLSLEPELRRWSDQFFWNRSADTHALLVDMTQTIHRTFRQVARHEKGIQDPIRTIALGGGSCRDLAMLMIGALRSRGIAARFVSGYVHLAEEEHEDEHQMTGGNTHAWVQGYVPVLAGSTSIRRRVLRETRTSSASRSWSTRATQFLCKGHGMGARRITSPCRLRCEAIAPISEAVAIAFNGNRRGRYQIVRTLQFGNAREVHVQRCNHRRGLRKFEAEFATDMDAHAFPTF
jgi:hypothetical protein